MVLLVAVLVVVGAAWFAGARETSYNSLRGDVAAGRTHRVEITGGLNGTRGSALTSYRWHAGAYWHVAEATESSGPDETDDMSTTSNATLVLYGDVAAQLRAIAPHRDLRVVRTGREISGYSAIAGWRVPDWTLYVAMFMWLGAIFVLVNGPQPRWATRWAWFWVIATPLNVVGVPLFLLASGSWATTYVDSPVKPRWRLTGGKAFLLTFVVSSVLGISWSQG